MTGCKNARWGTYLPPNVLRQRGRERAQDNDMNRASRPPAHIYYVAALISTSFPLTSIHLSAKT